MHIRTTPLTEAHFRPKCKASLPGDGEDKFLKEESIYNQHYSLCPRTSGCTHAPDPREALAEKPVAQQVLICSYLVLFCFLDLRGHRTYVSKQPVYFTCLTEERHRLMEQEMSCFSVLIVLTPRCEHERFVRVEEGLHNHHAQHELSKLMLLDTSSQASS